MKILVIDNYDSFTFNLVQLVGKFTNDILVLRNDKTTIDEIKKLAIDKIIISPGPGRPENSNVSLEVIDKLKGLYPILGVCLGHQGIAVTFGGKIVPAIELMHGKTSSVIHDEKTIYTNVPQNFTAGRYHSLIVDNESLPNSLEISAHTADGTIMSIRHKDFDIEGIQFHPESILTEQGVNIINNWIKK